MSARVRIGVGIVSIAIVGFSALRRRLRPRARISEHAPAQSRQLLERAAPFLRLPTSPDRPPEVLLDGSGLRCPSTGTVYPYHKGVLDLLPKHVALTETQHILNTALTAWAYDRGRDLIVRWLGSPNFSDEVAMALRGLQLHRDDIVLDLACGHGNFTVEWAKRVGPEGLVIGLDISPAMLARAAMRVAHSKLHNVLLIRGDALRLPLVDGQFLKVNCSGGFHQFPDLPQALREISRVSAPGARLTASTFAEDIEDRRAPFKRWLKERFALHFVPLNTLGNQLENVGYSEYNSSLPGGWFGYLAARKLSS